MYFAISLPADSDSQFHHAARETIVGAMKDAKSRPSHDAQIVQVSGLRRVVARREAGQSWSQI